MAAQGEARGPGRVAGRRAAEKGSQPPGPPEAAGTGTTACASDRKSSCQRNPGSDSPGAGGGEGGEPPRTQGAGGPGLSGVGTLLSGLHCWSVGAQPGVGRLLFQGRALPAFQGQMDELTDLLAYEG